MTSGPTSAREGRCRRAAGRRGLVVRKSRRQADQGSYALVDLSANVVVYGANSSGNFCADLEDIEAWLSN